MNEPVIIDEEFKNLFPPLKPEEFSKLEMLCKKEGIKYPLTTWNGILVDGHNRLQISEDWDLNYDVEELDKDIYRTRADAKQWAIDNQLARRNLTLSEIIKAQESVAKDLEAEAKKRHDANGGDKVSVKAKAATVNLPQPVNNNGKRNPTVSEQMAAKVGVSDKTYRDARLVVNKGTPEQIERMDKGGRGNGVSKIANEIRAKDTPKKECRVCHQILPMSEFSRHSECKDGVRSICKSCEAQRRNSTLRDAKGHVIGSTGEFDSVPNEEIGGSLYSDEIPEITIQDVVEEFMVNFETYVNNLKSILDCNKDVADKHPQEICNMLSKANDVFQSLRKEYTQ